MKKDKRVRVLIVEDSMIFKAFLKQAFESDPGMVVVGLASNPFEARDLIIELQPDVMTLDVSLPKMDGLEFLKQLLPQYPLPVVVISSASDKVLMAMEVGAVDFIAKPNIQTSLEQEKFLREVQTKVKIASMSRVMSNRSTTQTNLRNITGSLKYDVIAVGASTGGTEAFTKLMGLLPKNLPPIVVVQHMPPVFTKLYAERLNATFPHQVCEAENGMVLKSGVVYIAPGDKHMELVRTSAGMKVHLLGGEKVNGHRPSVDILFQSVARLFGRKAIGVILTGMGYDGAKGLLEMKKQGAYTIGQDQESSVVYGMPMVAFNIGAVKKQSSIENMGSIIVRELKS